MSDPRTLLAVHPATDRHPRAWVAVHDPSAHRPTADATPMACWVVGCDCGRSFPLEPATPQRVAELVAEAAALPADRAQDGRIGRRPGDGSGNPQKRSQRVSLADALLGSHGVDHPTGSAHPGDQPLPLWPDGGAR